MMRLLIVDDHAGARQLIREIFSHVTSDICECVCAEEALALCPSFHPDVVTMDYRLPGMDGISALERIRGEHPNARLILITHCTQPVIRERAQRAGADRVVTKDWLLELPEYVRSLHAARGEAR